MFFICHRGLSSGNCSVSVTSRPAALSFLWFKAAIKSVVTTLYPLPTLINKGIAYNMPPIITVIYGTA